MSASLLKQWLRPAWQALLEQDGPIENLHDGPRWEEDFDELHRPVSDAATALRSRLASVLGGDPRQYWLGQRITRIRQQLMELLRPEARLLLAQPETPFHVERLRGLGMQVDVVPPDLQPGDVDGLLEHWQGKTALIWLQSPSPLTGRAWTVEAVTTLCAHVRAFSLVVVDLSLEDPGNPGRWQACMDQQENLLLVREFDSGWGLPGLQLAALQAPEPWVAALRGIWPEQQLSRALQRAALDVFTHENQGLAARSRQALMQRGRALCERWAGKPQVRHIHLYQAPFLLLQVTQPAALQSVIRRCSPENLTLPADWLGEGGWFRLPLADERLCQVIDEWLQASKALEPDPR